ncbi:O-antigen ligase family protein [Ruegeria aquimaris]|uniref:O-Antigen ligase n=1 Tax=Ruegeria aquimaris TaxID=2984333 RepID=A0ABT3ADV4_9RHOB|nr:O-antigen ligase family protein [Ruegeria sp. XHP0148]MCV2886859.1 hypothetical protein [Ruegeria sp. XHP0148]
MTSATPRATTPRMLLWATTVLLATLSLTWIQVASAAGFQLKVPYVATIALGIVLCGSPSRFATGLNALLPAVFPWLIVYMIYLALLSINLAGAPSKGIVLRQVFFVICGLTFAVSLVAATADNRILRRGGALAIVSFFVVTEYLARQIGLSWITAIIRFATTGDLDYIFYHFLREIFQTVAPAGVEVPASEKNIVAVCVFTALILFRSGHTSAKPDILGIALTLFLLGVLVVFNTRSVLMISALGIPTAAWIRLLREGVRNPGEFYIKSFAILALLIVLILLLSAGSAAMDELEARLSFNDNSTEGRLSQYSWALSQIERNPLLGSGLIELKGQLVHNLFLGAWLHAGLAPFLLVVSTYLLIVLSWLRFVAAIVFRPALWVLPLRAEWVAILPMLPLFRVWVAGDAGHPGFGEWIALGAFFGLVAANRLAQNASSRNAKRPSGINLVVT